MSLHSQSTGLVPDGRINPHAFVGSTQGEQIKTVGISQQGMVHNKIWGKFLTFF